MWYYWHWDAGSQLPVYRTDAPDTSAKVYEVWDGTQWTPAKPGNAVFRSFNGDEAFIAPLTEAEATKLISV